MSSSAIVGRITIVQEDRIRVLGDDGRGYLLVVTPGAASTRQLEEWRDLGTRLEVRYAGEPDAGGRATAFKVVE